MGCATSKEARRDRRRQKSPSPYSRAQSMPVNGSTNKIVDSHGHIVALTSTTLGSLRLDSDQQVLSDVDDEETDENAKTWSETVIKRLPKTPTKTPISESPPETINAWELMEGLEGAYEEPPRSPEPKLAGIVKGRIEEFQRRIDAKKEKEKSSKFSPPNSQKKVVLYFTSLRGVRRTYEDCWEARAILQGYGVKIDERDVSMHGGFKEELKAVLGVGLGGSPLPRVFANGAYLGGVDEVRAMHEDGRLWKAVEDCEALVAGKGGGVCEGCGGLRFVPCENCSGSCKVFVEEEEEEDGGGFRRCSQCNENGLVFCAFCL